MWPSPDGRPPFLALLVSIECGGDELIDCRLAGCWLLWLADALLPIALDTCCICCCGLLLRLLIDWWCELWLFDWWLTAWRCRLAACWMAAICWELLTAVVDEAWATRLDADEFSAVFSISGWCRLVFISFSWLSSYRKHFWNFHHQSKPIIRRTQAGGKQANMESLNCQQTDIRRLIGVVLIIFRWWIQIEWLEFRNLEKKLTDEKGATD